MYDGPISGLGFSKITVDMLFWYGGEHFIYIFFLSIPCLSEFLHYPSLPAILLFLYFNSEITSFCRLGGGGGGGGGGSFIPKLLLLSLIYYNDMYKS